MKAKEWEMKIKFIVKRSSIVRAKEQITRYKQFSRSRIHFLAVSSSLSQYDGDLFEEF